MTSLHSKALQFSVLGYAVIPLGKNKKPLLGAWKQYETKMPTEREIEYWWTKWPSANIGIVTGKISGITVIDLDTDKETGVLYTTPDKFPKTFTVRTPSGGYHLYYEYSNAITTSVKAYPKLPGVDVRNDGGYVVAAHSVTDYLDKGVKKGGLYEIVTQIELAPLPTQLFNGKAAKRSLMSKISVKTGGRNESIASFAGQLLHSAPEKEWLTEVWDAVQTANKTYSPPLSDKELKATFESIMNRERERRVTLTVSPMQIGPTGIEEAGEEVSIKIRKNGNGMAYKDMANVLAILSQHPYYKGTIRYNEFRQEIEYKGKPLEDKDITKIQYFMQTDAELHGVSDTVVASAIVHYAHQNSYDEAQDWLKSLTWDKAPRLHNWIHKASGVEDDDYHAGIGSQWFMGMIRRIMEPGSTFDYVLLLVGPQGIGKTSFFRILGGPWYKSYTGAMDNKDFYLALRGAIIVDLDEGAALSKGDAIKIKSIITETHDEFRAPYGKVMKKYPRRFVFSMSTNDTEPFKDSTGNRRYWVVDAQEAINFSWLEANRDQLFAEAYHAYTHKTKLPEVPYDKALASQESHLPEDSWTNVVMEYLRKDNLYCAGDPTFFTTTPEVYQGIFPDEESLMRLGRSQEMRIAQVLKAAGLENKRVMIDGERARRWMLTPKRAEEIARQGLKSARDPLADEFGNVWDK